jgi:regulator of sigma E protease
MTIAISILGLAVLIFLHELGHFLVSLALRMRPRRFYVGFPPAVWSTTRNGIEYGIGAIPLGGFVKIPGMHRPAPADVDVALTRALEEVPALAGPTTRLRQALADGDHDAARALVGTIREELDGRPLSPAAAKASERGLTDLGDALGPDAYWRAATWKRVATIAAGPLANILLALVLFTGLEMYSGGEVTTRIAHVEADSAAAGAGIESGDRLVSIGGTPVTPERIAELVARSQGKPVVVVVERDGSDVTLPAVSPRKSGDRYVLGVRLDPSGLSLPAAAVRSAELTWDVTRAIGSSLARLVTGEGRKEISSTVGIVQGSSQAAEEGTDIFLYVMGLVSLSIALLNLLPLLPLDGGHIVFAVAEGIRGRAVAREVYERVSFVGIALVLLLFFIGLQNDITRIS